MVHAGRDFGLGYHLQAVRSPSLVSLHCLVGVLLGLQVVGQSCLKSHFSVSDREVRWRVDKRLGVPNEGEIEPEKTLWVTGRNVE